MLILRSPLPSDRFYLGHNYSLFEARSSTGYIKVSFHHVLLFVPLRRFSVFILGYDDECIVRDWGAGQALTSVTYNFGERWTDARAREHIDTTQRCHRICRTAETFAANRGCPCEIILRCAKWELRRIVNGKSIVDRKLVNEPALTVADGFTLDWKEIFRA